MRNYISEAVNSITEIETLGIFIESITDFVGPILVDENSCTLSGKKIEIGEYLAATISVMIPINKKPSVIKDFKHKQNSELHRV